MPLFQSLLLPLLWTFYFGNHSNNNPLTISPIEEKDESEILLESLAENHENLPSLTTLDLALEGYEKLENELKKEQAAEFRANAANLLDRFKAKS